MFSLVYNKKNCCLPHIQPLSSAGQQVPHDDKHDDEGQDAPEPAMVISTCKIINMKT